MIQSIIASPMFTCVTCFVALSIELIRNYLKLNHFIIIVCFSSLKWMNIPFGVMEFPLSLDSRLIDVYWCDKKSSMCEIMKVRLRIFSIFFGHCHCHKWWMIEIEWNNVFDWNWIACSNSQISKFKTMTLFSST